MTEQECHLERPRRALALNRARVQAVRFIRALRQESERSCVRCNGVGNDLVRRVCQTTLAPRRGDSAAAGDSTLRRSGPSAPCGPFPECRSTRGTRPSCGGEGRRQGHKPTPWNVCERTEVENWRHRALPWRVRRTWPAPIRGVSTGGRCPARDFWVTTSPSDVMLRRVTFRGYVPGPAAVGIGIRRGPPLRRSPVRNGALRCMGTVAVLFLFASGCRGNGGDPKAVTSTTGATTTSTPPTSSTIAPDPGHAEILAAYQAFWDDFRAAADPMNPAHPRLEAHSTGRELSFLRTRFTRLRGERIVIRGSIDLAAKVTSVEGDKAVLEDCHDASKLLQYDSRTGELRDTVDERRSFFRVEMLRTADGWKVEYAEQLRQGCEPSA